MSDGPHGDPKAKPMKPLEQRFGEGETIPPPSDMSDQLRYERQRHNRIEGLRAAAQVMGAAQNPTWRGDSSITLALARDFAQWLETGEMEE